MGSSDHHTIFEAPRADLQGPATYADVTDNAPIASASSRVEMLHCNVGACSVIVSRFVLSDEAVMGCLGLASTWRNTYTKNAIWCAVPPCADYDSFSI